MKRTLALILALVMVLSMSAFAAADGKDTLISTTDSKVKVLPGHFPILRKLLLKHPPSPPVHADSFLLSFDNT